MTAAYHRTFFAALLAGAIALPALAQSTPAPPPSSDPAQEAARGYAAPAMPNQAAINAGGQAGTAALNNQASDASQGAQANADVAAANQAQYDADRQAYMVALMRHDAAVNRTDRRYVRQQNAYADAMAAWRAQVVACKSGHQKACDMPPPNPADYY